MLDSVQRIGMSSNTMPLPLVGKHPDIQQQLVVLVPDSRALVVLLAPDPDSLV